MDFLSTFQQAAAERGEHLLVLVAAICGLGFLALIGRVIYNIYFHPLSSYPGPKLWGGSRIPGFWYSVRGLHVRKVNEFHAKYGPVVRIGPTEISYASATAWKTIYGHRINEMAKVFDGRGGLVKPPNGVDNILTSSRIDHSRFRRNVSHAFSEKALRDQEGYIQDYVSQLIAGLKKVAATGAAQDMSRWYNYTTFDVIGDLAFGEPFDCLRNNSFHDYVHTIFESIKVNPWFHITRYYKFLTAFENWIIPKDLREARLRNYKVAGEKMARRMINKDENRQDFTSYMLRHSDDKGLSQAELKNMAVILIIAGSETTATLLTGATYYLLNNPRTYERLAKEVRDRFKSEDEITLSAVNELKYILAVLEEALRLHPPVPTSIPRVVPGEGELIDGKWVPGGTAVGVHQSSTYLLEDNFYRAKEFIPERWLDIAHGGSPEFANDNKAAFQPFSFGPRNCVGKNLAYAEMRIILARVLFNFDLKLDEASYNWDNMRAPFLWDRKPMMAKLVPLEN